jgi:hypothetical protein
MCGSFLSANDIAGSERRQVHDLPRQKVEVTEHQVQTKVCGRCGMKNKAQFPSGCNAPAQYGAGVRGVAAYLMGYQLLPYDRCAEAMNDLFDCRLSVGTGQTPAAALTAYARVEDRLKVLNSGFQIHIPKPVEPIELVTVVANLAGRTRDV